MKIEYDEYELPLWKFFKFVHKYTERVAIYVVCGGIEALDDKVNSHYLTKNAFENQNEEERLLKYYKDIPLWNLHLDYEFIYDNQTKGNLLTGVLVANCHYKDVREAELQEKKDVQKKKRKDYRERKKQEKEKTKDKQGYNDVN